MHSAGRQHSAARALSTRRRPIWTRSPASRPRRPGAARPCAAVRRVARAVCTVASAPGDAHQTDDDSQSQGPAVRSRHRARSRAPWSQRRRTPAALVETVGANTPQSCRRTPCGVRRRKNPLYAWLERLERDKLSHERRRLLYVAATRAERSLRLLGACAVIPTRRRANCRCASQLRALRSSCYGPNRPCAMRSAGDSPRQAGSMASSLPKSHVTPSCAAYPRTGRYRMLPAPRSSRPRS